MWALRRKLWTCAESRHFRAVYSWTLDTSSFASSVCRKQSHGETSGSRGKKIKDDYAEANPSTVQVLSAKCCEVRGSNGRLGSIGVYAGRQRQK